MSWIRGVADALSARFRRAREQRELAEEMQFHLEMQTRRNVERGMDPVAARRLAEREFGSVARYRDEVRDLLGGAGPLEGLGHDVRFALRTARRSPGFGVVAVLTLALGIGATTAIFSVVDAVVLRPLPFPDPARLVALYETSDAFDRMLVSAPNFADWREQSRSFESMAAYRGGPTTVLGGREPVRVPAYVASRDFFRVLGASPQLGRAWTPDEARPGGPPVAVVSHEFWDHQLGRTRDLGGARVQLFGRTFSVVGVMPPDFDFPAGAQLWIPIEPFNEGIGRSSHNDETIARLRSGVSAERARAELSAIARRIAEQYPGDTEASGAAVVGLRDDLVGPVREYLTLLLGAVAFVLLVACVNLASAGLARAAVRGREMAIRTALGAGRGRLVRQLLTESVLLALAGGLGGLALAAWLVGGLLALSPRSLPRAAEVGVDGRVVAFALGLSVLTGILVGILPALRVSGTELRSGLTAGGRGAAAGGREGPLRALVGVETALALVLLVGAGLLIRSFRTLLAEDPGFDPRGVLTVDVSLPGTKYSDTARLAAYYDAALAAVAAIPGVERVGMINLVPMRRAGFGGLMAVGDRPGETRYADYRVVSADYFRTMRIPLLAGRLFDARDAAAAEHVTVVNRTLAERLWPGENPLGKRIRPLGMDQHRGRWLTVVGVVGDVRNAALARPPGPEHYVFYRQRPERAGDATLVIRARLPAGALAPAVRERLRALDRDVPVELATMDAEVARSVADRRFVMLILTGFGVVALALAAIGVYGVLSYAVARRTREIGVRMALGAQRASVLAMVLRDSMIPVAAGTLAGPAAALLLTRLLRSLLYGVSATDPLTFAAVAVLLTGVAVAASWLPARRASRIDPVIALRAE